MARLMRSIQDFMTEISGSPSVTIPRKLIFQQMLQLASTSGRLAIA